MSVTGATLERLATPFMLTRAQWFDNNFSDMLSEKMPGLTAVVQDAAYFAPAGTNTTVFKTVGGVRWVRQPAPMHPPGPPCASQCLP